jgi:membrane-bound metal-dependent hydrolase YbcI (DUF457 family)
MFIGHFGAGFAAKSATKQVSLGTLFIAAQFIDLLWPSFLLLGIERVSIEPGAAVVTPLAFEHYPFSHSLFAVLVWALLIGTGYWFMRRDRSGALVLVFLVISHWLLDAIVHQPDLPLMPGNEIVVGLNGWSSLPMTLAIELSLFAVGVWLYTHATRATDGIGRWGFAGLVALLLLIYAGNLFGTSPPSVNAIAWVGQSQWLLVLWGYWIDKHRHTQ